ncbi:MAG: lasso peptide biosynthesis B2 protein [Actinomyces sp.]|nr:lasso peptide biosynthesis B2 protein [Actinomyces sp.]
MSEILPDEPVTLTTWDQVQIHLALVGAKVLHRLPPGTMRRCLTRLSVGAVPAGYDDTKLARDQVLTASAFCRGGTACLLRSIAVTLVCRLRGTWPTWSVGVLTVPPFAAHAWVEADGRIVDEPMAQQDFQAFFTVPPRSRSTSWTTEEPRPTREEV